MPIGYWVYRPSCLLTIMPISHHAYWPSCLLTIMPIDHWAYWQSSLLTIEPIDHRAYRPSSLSTIEPINHRAYRPSSLSTIEPINHWAYQPSSLSTIVPSGLLSQLLSLLACFDFLGFFLKAFGKHWKWSDSSRNVKKKFCVGEWYPLLYSTVLYKIVQCTTFFLHFWMN